MSDNNITDEFREKWISKIYTTRFETMPEAVRWIRENITDHMEASILHYSLAAENLKQAIERLQAENSKMRKALEEIAVLSMQPGDHWSEVFDKAESEKISTIKK